MKVLIIEDEAPAFRRLQKLLEEINPDLEIVEVLDSVEDSVKWFNNHQLPDLIFSDIQLSDGISFEIFDQVQITKPVIFTTAFDEYMLRAFRVNSIDYLLKPIKKEDLEKSLSKFAQMKASFGGGTDISELLKSIKLDEKEYKTRFLTKVGDKLVSVEAENIAYFQTRHGVVHMITLQGRSYLMDQTLDELAGQLEPDKFFRVNRQFLVQFKAIQSVNRYHKGKLLVLLNPATEEGVIVSAEKATEFKKWLGD
ncbi:MAG: DNA-binding LytR/AlgR family response regulator [Cyclobacteriaceae bacterium]|jgi:DNA-binding LytR/AlgR family response regulator